MSDALRDKRRERVSHMSNMRKGYWKQEQKRTAKRALAQELRFTLNGLQVQSLDEHTLIRAQLDGYEVDE